MNDENNVSSMSADANNSSVHASSQFTTEDYEAQNSLYQEKIRKNRQRKQEEFDQ